MPAAATRPNRLSDHAYLQLRDRIVRLELPPGALIDERETMAELGVGRTPLREAIQRLAHDGLVDVVPRRGHFIAPVSLSDLTHVFELRQAVEGLSARLAAQRATEADCASLEALLVDAREHLGGQEIDRHLEIDRQFHSRVAATAGNRYLREDVDRLFALSVRIQRLSGVSLTTIDHELTNYEGVVAAIRDGRPDEAERWMRQHLDPTDPWLLPAPRAAGSPSRP